MNYVISPEQWSSPLKWKLKPGDKRDPDGVRITFSGISLNHFSNHPPTKQEWLDRLKSYLQPSVRWLTPGFDEWIVDLEALREEFPELSTLNCLKGRIAVKPQITIKEADASVDRRERARMHPSYRPGYDIPADFLVDAWFWIVPEMVKKAVMLAEAPLGIHHSLAHFRLDFPKPEEVAFIIMRFGTSDAHTSILEGIKKALGAAGLIAIRADERHYHDDLFNNVLTYMHGCGFGIAVFERLEESDFNPNVALEVGYMLAMQKPVCILKDRTLQALPTDLMGKLYSEFDSLDPVASISRSLSVWLRDKKLA